MNNRYIVSIVIPVYNSEKYIRRCLNSIVKQTVKNYKVIIVDDGSTDNSFSICKEYADMYDNLECYSIKEAGVSKARNYGISKVKTKYIMFMDSDDVVSERFVEVLLKTIEDTKCNIAECRFKRISKMEQIDFCDDIIEYTVLDKENAIEKLTKNEYTHYVWNKIFKTAIFNGIRFIPGRYYEDIAIMYKLFERAERIAYVDAELYGYCINPDSITNTHDDKKREDILLCWIEQYEYFKEKHPQLMERCLEKISHYYLNAFDYAQRYDQRLRRINHYMIRYYSKIMKSNITKKNKVKITVAKMIPRVYILKNKN